MAKKDKAAAEAAEAQKAADKKGKKGGKGKEDTAGPEADAKKAKKEKKAGKKKGLFKFILILLLVAALAGFGLCFFFDWLHLRTGIMDLLSKIGPEDGTYTAVLQQREEELDQKEAELEQLQEELQAQADQQKADETRLDMLQEEMDARETALTQVEISNTPIFRGELTDEKLAELKNLGKIYSNMSAESASIILPQLYSTADMASIIFYMDKIAAADLLAALPPEISAQITTEMLRE